MKSFYKRRMGERMKSFYIGNWCIQFIWFKRDYSFGLDFSFEKSFPKGIFIDLWFLSIDIYKTVDW